MPIEIRDLDEGRGNLIIGSGTVTSEEYLTTHKAHLTQAEDKFRKYRYSLCDYTTVTKVEISSKDVQLIAKLSKDAAAVNPDAVVAVVADRDVIYGLSRMWQISSDGTQWEIRVFKSTDDAKKWIVERVKERFGIDDLTLGCTGR
jgi:hypothetical protein